MSIWTRLHERESSQLEERQDAVGMDGGRMPGMESTRGSGAPNEALEPVCREPAGGDVVEDFETLETAYPQNVPNHGQGILLALLFVPVWAVTIWMIVLLINYLFGC